METIQPPPIPSFPTKLPSLDLPSLRLRFNSLYSQIVRRFMDTVLQCIRGTIFRTYTATVETLQPIFETELQLLEDYDPPPVHLSLLSQVDGLRAHFSAAQSAITAAARGSNFTNVSNIAAQTHHAVSGVNLTALQLPTIPKPSSFDASATADAVVSRIPSSLPPLQFYNINLQDLFDLLYVLRTIGFIVDIVYRVIDSFVIIYRYYRTGETL
uniref:Catalase-peroxidase n=1 Tax=Lygus hesperus TaxID=30085 RepID=A0A0A9W2U8_LYGHE